MFATRPTEVSYLFDMGPTYIGRLFACTMPTEAVICWTLGLLRLVTCLKLHGLTEAGYFLDTTAYLGRVFAWH